MTLAQENEVANKAEWRAVLRRNAGLAIYEGHEAFPFASVDRSRNLALVSTPS